MKLPEVGSLWEFWKNGKYWYTCEIIKVIGSHKTTVVQTRFLDYPNLDGPISEVNTPITWDAISPWLVPHKSRKVKEDLKELLK